MVLFLECVIACILFGVGIVGSVIKNPVFWLHDFAPAAQKKFLSLHPEYTPTDKKESLLTLIAKKVAACILFVLLLLLMVYLAGARDFGRVFFTAISFGSLSICLTYLSWICGSWPDGRNAGFRVPRTWTKPTVPITGNTFWTAFGAWSSVL